MFVTSSGHVSDATNGWRLVMRQTPRPLCGMTPPNEVSNEFINITIDFLQLERDMILRNGKLERDAEVNMPGHVEMRVGH